jgi:hypothetical protein
MPPEPTPENISFQKEVDEFAAHKNLNEELTAAQLLKERENVKSLRQKKNILERSGGVIISVVSGITAMFALYTGCLSIKENAEQSNRAYNFKLTDDIIRLVSSAQNDTNEDQKKLSLKLLTFYELDAIPFYMYLLNESSIKEKNSLQNLILYECLRDIQQNPRIHSDGSKLNEYTKQLREGFNDLVNKEIENNPDIPLITKYASVLNSLTGNTDDNMKMYKQWNSGLKHYSQSRPDEYSAFHDSICKFISQPPTCSLE